MIRSTADDRPSPLEQIAYREPRRRRRALVEVQPARCPRCERVMVLLLARGGPRYHCACDDRAAISAPPLAAGRRPS